MANRRAKRPIVVAPQKNDPGLVETMARTAVIAGTASATVGATKAVAGAVTGGGKQAGAAQAAAAAGATPEEIAAQAAAAAEQAGLTPEQIEQLKQIAELKVSGVLTEEEFAAQKAKILAAT